jgi:hypothetical protein
MISENTTIMNDICNVSRINEDWIDNHPQPTFLPSPEGSLGERVHFAKKGDSKPFINVQ